jgi:hypothetical protein
MKGNLGQPEKQASRVRAGAVGIGENTKAKLFKNANGMNGQRNGYDLLQDRL